VKYVGTRELEWSHDKRGNYWSDLVAFDLDGDGLANQTYQPNTIADQILWRYPLAKLLMNSPILQILQWAQSEFPSLHPGGVMDSYPLMSPVSREAPIELH
jgi:nitrous oxidase accessory protein